MQERDPIVLHAKLEAEQRDREHVWHASVVVGVDSWLSAGEQEIAVPGSPFPNRELAVQACMTLVAKRLAGEP